MTVLPVLLESCDLPVFLQDIKYADYKELNDPDFQDIVRAIITHEKRIRVSV